MDVITKAVIDLQFNPKDCLIIGTKCAGFAKDASDEKRYNTNLLLCIKDFFGCRLNDVINFRWPIYIQA